MTGFLDALAREGAELAALVSWRDVLEDPHVMNALPDRPCWVRVESTGENPVVLNHLLRLGGRGDVRPARGQLVAPTARHRGFLRALDRVADALRSHPQWVPIAHPRAIASVFDKRSFHDAALDQGVAVPERLEVCSVDALEEALDERHQSVFVKLRYSSSASGIAVYRHRPRPRLMTTVRMSREGFFNSLRVQRVEDPARIRTLLTWLIEVEDAQIEWAIPKARLNGTLFDCRVLMVSHEPAFVVVRHARHPITNLHLGGWRGSVDDLRAACPDPTWAGAMEDCRRVSRAYGGLHLGLDVIFEPRFRGHRILEANAFGDLLPRLTRNGRDVYAYEVASAPDWYASATRG